MKEQNKKIETYIHENEDKYISIISLKQMILVLAFISLFAFVSIVFKKALPWSAILIFLTLAYMMYVFWIRQKAKTKNTFNLRFKVNAEASLFYSLYFLILSFCLLSYSTHNPSIYIVLFSLFLIFGLVYNGLTLYMVKKIGHLNSRKKKSSKICSVLLISALLGVSCAKILRTVLSNNLMIILGAFGACVVSYVCLIGTTNFIKYYYSIKHKINVDLKGNNSSLLLIENRSKNKGKRHLSLIFPAIMILFFYILVIIGIVSQQF